MFYYTIICLAFLSLALCQLSSTLSNYCAVINANEASDAVGYFGVQVGIRYILFSHSIFIYITNTNIDGYFFSLDSRKRSKLFLLSKFDKFQACKYLRLVKGLGKILIYF